MSFLCKLSSVLYDRTHSVRGHNTDLYGSDVREFNFSASSHRYQMSPSQAASHSAQGPSQYGIHGWNYNGVQRPAPNPQPRSDTNDATSASNPDASTSLQRSTDFFAPSDYRSRATYYGYPGTQGMQDLPDFGTPSCSADRVLASTVVPPQPHSQYLHQSDNVHPTHYTGSQQLQHQPATIFDSEYRQLHDLQRSTFSQGCALAHYDAVMSQSSAAAASQSLRSSQGLVHVDPQMTFDRLPAQLVAQHSTAIPGQSALSRVTQVLAPYLEGYHREGLYQLTTAGGAHCAGTQSMPGQHTGDLATPAMTMRVHASAQSQQQFYCQTEAASLQSALHRTVPPQDTSSLAAVQVQPPLQTDSS